MEKNLTVGDDEKKVVKEWFEELRNIICCLLYTSDAADE